MSQASVQLFAVPNSKSTLQSSLRTESHQNKCYWSEPTSTMYGRKIVNALFSAWTTNPPTWKIITISMHNTSCVNATDNLWNSVICHYELLGYTHASHEKSGPLDLENKKSLCQLILQESYLLFIIALTTPMHVKNTVSSIHWKRSKSLPLTFHRSCMPAEWMWVQSALAADHCKQKVHARPFHKKKRRSTGHP